MERVELHLTTRTNQDRPQRCQASFERSTESEGASYRYEPRPLGQLVGDQHGTVAQVSAAHQHVGSSPSARQDMTPGTVGKADPCAICVWKQAYPSSTTVFGLCLLSRPLSRGPLASPTFIRKCTCMQQGPPSDAITSYALGAQGLSGSASDSHSGHICPKQPARFRGRLQNTRRGECDQLQDCPMAGHLQISIAHLLYCSASPK